ncbi:hypothetical protein PTSG_06230 [Salpingoeca rosetta]|uniref:Alpha-1,3-glucosyltransferase n=1 Tax=Salpingoeca rosetta (strain ATCC 50818 / BSB-021) TaxID=946362 RepID=F2UCB2_SALR5|nr:uncharacterized protein PTSG_06230 [Salpingoeca rosetta]EGD74219.1 hypothetical protein PTSG_06230 [Salpingoeca rosetta]|eukprot:XP_004993119.1 hypothetical protein PTSG_06230 [Salpingoeca rosetta]
MVWSWWLVAAVVAAGVCLRALVGLGGHSGFGNPPMHGDFEAQRHWMEITYHTPVKEWYFNTTNNDLQYWGLDYPPLTAYHSWVCGWLAHNVLNPTWVALHASRGAESGEVRLFMRSMALLADVLVFLPAAVAYAKVAFVQRQSEQKRRSAGLAVATATAAGDAMGVLAALVFNPCFVLIDHGHFQFNAISLGLALWAVVCVRTGRHLLGSALFVLSICYKQMSLYYAPVFFFNLLGSSFQAQGRQGWLTWFFSSCCRVALIGFVVVASFAICFLPFIFDWTQFSQVLHRMFPLARGLFEDKVANAWCIADVVLKFRRNFDNTTLARCSLVATVTAFLPSCVHTCFRPTQRNFSLALVNCSLSFFLFSFQVHEKSILLAALPIALVAHRFPAVATAFMATATITLFPLLHKDGQSLQFVSCLGVALSIHALAFFHRLSAIKIAAVLVSVVVGAGLCVVYVVVPPPARLPDLWSLAIAAYGFVHFALALLYFTAAQLFGHEDGGGGGGGDDGSVGAQVTKKQKKKGGKHAKIKAQ